MAAKKKLDRTNLHARVAPYTGDKLKKVEQRKGAQQEASKPELLKSVKYEITYEVGA